MIAFALLLVAIGVLAMTPFGQGFLKVIFAIILGCVSLMFIVFALLAVSA